jgi:hypothetical protein
MAKDSKTTETATAPATTGKRKVESLFADAWKPVNIGDTLTGIYLGAQEAMSNKTKDVFTAYHIKVADGRRLSLTGASLASIMPQIPRKTEITVTYRGMVESGRGDMKVFDVEIPEGVALIDPMDNDEE